VDRVTADSNIFVAAIRFGGRPQALLDLACDGEIDLAISEPILNETLPILTDKFRYTPTELQNRGALRDALVTARIRGRSARKAAGRQSCR